MGLQHAHIADNGVERRPQLMRKACQKVVLQAAGVLHARVHSRILERHRGPSGDADDDALVVSLKNAYLRVTEEQAADHLAATPLDGDGEVAAHGRSEEHTSALQS